MLSVHTAPRKTETPADDELRRIWCQTLKVHDLRDDDDFFEQGGTSLQAMEIIAAIEGAYGVKLPLSSFIECPTIALMRARLADSPAPLKSPLLIRFQAGGDTLPPLFLVHGLLGHIFLAPDFLQGIDPGRPVYGIQARGLASDHAPSRSIAEAVRDYAEAIHEVCGGQPFHLGGFCHGNLIVLEMAALLNAEQGRVSPPILIDPPVRPRGFTWKRGFLGGVRLALQRRFGRILPDTELAHRLERARGMIAAPDIVDPNLRARILAVSGNMWRLLRYHTPHRLTEPVVLLTSRDRYQQMFEPDSYWHSHDEGCLTVEIAGESHFGLFGEDRNKLSATLNDTLERLDRQAVTGRAGTKHRVARARANVPIR